MYFDYKGIQNISNMYINGNKNRLKGILYESTEHNNINNSLSYRIRLKKVRTVSKIF